MIELIFIYLFNLIFINIYKTNNAPYIINTICYEEINYSTDAIQIIQLSYFDETVKWNYIFFRQKHDRV